MGFWHVCWCAGSWKKVISFLPQARWRAIHCTLTKRVWENPPWQCWWFSKSTPQLCLSVVKVTKDKVKGQILERQRTTQMLQRLLCVMQTSMWDHQSEVISECNSMVCKCQVATADNVFMLSPPLSQPLLMTADCQQGPSDQKYMFSSLDISIWQHFPQLDSSILLSQRGWSKIKPPPTVTAGSARPRLATWKEKPPHLPDECVRLSVCGVIRTRIVVGVCVCVSTATDCSLLTSDPC